MKRIISTFLLVLVGCTAIQQPMPKSRGCNFYCFPKTSVTNYLISLITSNQITGIVKSYVPGGVLPLDATNDVVTAVFNQLICSNQPQYVITFAWFCSNQLHSVDKQLPSNSYDVDYGPLADCGDCSWSVAYLQASVCDTQKPQVINENGKMLMVNRRK